MPEVSLAFRFFFFFFSYRSQEIPFILLVVDEHQRIDAFELWCWRRLLRVPWTARRSNQSILKEISPEYFLEGLMLKLKIQYLGHLMQRTDSLEKTLMLEKIEGGGEGDDRGWDGWMASSTQWTQVWVNSWSWRWIGRPGVLQSMGSQRVGHNWVTELNWTENMKSPNWRVINLAELCSRNVNVLEYHWWASWLN